MKMKIVLFPTLFAILMAISSIGFPVPGTTYGTPWMTAVHTQTLQDNQTYGVDNIAFYLWGQQYTVVGKIIQNHFTPYDWRDFPFYSMALVIISIITGCLAIILSRNTAIVIRGKEIKIASKSNPIIFLLVSMSLMTIAAIYLYISAVSTIVPLLEFNNYTAEYSYGLRFMGISSVAFLVSVLMTYISSKKMERSSKSAVQAV